MRFTVDQTIAYAASEAAAAFADPTLYEGFGDLPKIQQPEVLEHQVEGARVRLRIRYRFAGELSAAARRLIDPARLTWVDESVHDLDARTVTFELQPDHDADRFRCRGRYRFDETTNGCVRRADIDLKVSFPLVGRAVEGAIASGLREHLHDEIGVVETYLAARGAGRSHR